MRERSLALFKPPPDKAGRAKMRLFEAALVVFGERGPEGATVRDIAAAAGQNVASIAYHFGGKGKLYRTVLEAIVRGILENLWDVVERVEAFRRDGGNSPAEAKRLLQFFLGALYLRLLSRDDAVSIVRIVVREQLGPTPAFRILYEGGFRRVHELLCFLVGVALGREPDEQETILRTHLLMGQAYFFAMSREAILRRVGWRSLEGRNAEVVAGLLSQHLEVLLRGLARAEIQKQRSKL